jgi:hypothetical protein
MGILTTLGWAAYKILTLPLLALYADQEQLIIILILEPINPRPPPVCAYYLHTGNGNITFYTCSCFLELFGSKPQITITPSVFHVDSTGMHRTQ